MTETSSYSNRKIISRSNYFLEENLNSTNEHCKKFRAIRFLQCEKLLKRQEIGLNLSWF